MGEYHNILCLPGWDPDPAITTYCGFLWSLTLIPLETIKDFVNEEIRFVESRQTLYDIYFLILKDQGISYQSLRRSWIEEHSRQLDLFNADRSN